MRWFRIESVMEEKEAFKLLASADRQILLDELLERDREATEEELSKRVASRRHGVPSESVSDEKIQDARLRLAHNHLPLLVEKDIVQWDEEKVVLVEEEHVDQLFEAAQVLEGRSANTLPNHLP